MELNCTYIHHAHAHGHVRFVCTDRSRVPELGFGAVLDGVRHLLCLALDLLTVGRIDEEVDSEYIQRLRWYDALPGVLGDNEDCY